MGNTQCTDIGHSVGSLRESVMLMRAQVHGLVFAAGCSLTCSKVGGGEASGMRSASCGGSSKGSSRTMVWRMLHTNTQNQQTGRYDQYSGVVLADQQDAVLLLLDAGARDICSNVLIQGSVL